MGRREELAAGVQHGHMTLQARTLAMSLSVDDALGGVVTLGLLEAERVSSQPLPPEFAHERDAVVQRWIDHHAGKQPADIPSVQETRSLFHRLGIDPTKHRPSSEALLRRVLQGRGLPTVNSVVDVCNLVSLEHQLPLGLYDRDRLRGPVRVRLGREGEGYSGIRKQHVNLRDKLLLADDDGPFGAPTSDSARTSVTETTTNVLVVLFCPADRSTDLLSAALERVADGITRFCGGTVIAVRVVQ